MGSIRIRSNPKFPIKWCAIRHAMPSEIGSARSMRQWRATQREVDFWANLREAEKQLLLANQYKLCFMCELDNRMKK